MCNKYLIFQSLAFVFLVFCGHHAVGQDEGDRVVVTAEVLTKIHNKRVGRVRLGEIDTIKKVNGNWCHLSRTKGWLPKRYVMNLKQGEKHFSSLIKKNQNDFHSWAIRGFIRFEQERFAQAIADLNESIKLNAENPAVFNNRGVVLDAQNRFKEAIADFDRAISLNPKYADAYHNRGVAYRSLGRELEAIANFDKAISLAAANPFFLVERGSVKNTIGQFKAAKEDFVAALKIDGDISDAYTGLSIVYLADEDLPRAYQLAKRAVEKDPNSGLAFNQRGWVNYKLERLPAALKDFDKAVKLAPSLSIAHNNRGLCHRSMGDFNKAIKDFDKSIKLNPKDAEAFTNRGTTFMEGGQFAAAKSDFEKAIELAPEYADALNGLGWLMATCNDRSFWDGKRAAELAEKACRISQRKNWRHLDTLAAAMARQGKFDAAIEAEKAAILAAPSNEHAELEQRLTKFKKQQAHVERVSVTL